MLHSVSRCVEVRFCFPLQSHLFIVMEERLDYAAKGVAGALAYTQLVKGNLRDWFGVDFDDEDTGMMRTHSTYNR